MNAELRKVKEYAGLSPDSIAFNAELWIDGTLAAHVEADGHGGSVFFRYVDRNHGKSEFETAFEAWLSAMPPVPCDDFGPMDMDSELWVGQELDRINLEKTLQRKCARNTLIRMVGDLDTEFRSFKPARKYSPAFAAQLREKHGDKLIEILNERFIKGVK